MVKRASLWTRVRDLGVPRAFIIAVIVAIILWLAMIAAGDAALVVGLSIPVYVVFFGTAFVSAVGRSRFLPIAEGIRFLLPILAGMLLVMASGMLGVRTAQLLNATLFGMSDSFLRVP